MRQPLLLLSCFLSIFSHRNKPIVPIRTFRNHTWLSKHNRAIIGNIFHHNTVSSDAHVIANPNAANDLGATPYKDIVPNHRRTVSVTIQQRIRPYSNLMKNRASFPDFCRGRNSYTVKAVWETRSICKCHIQGHIRIALRYQLFILSPMPFRSECLLPKRPKIF